MAYYSCHINRYKYEWYYKGDDKTVWRDMCHDSYFLYFVSLFAYILFLFNVVKKDKLTVS